MVSALETSLQALQAEHDALRLQQQKVWAQPGMQRKEMLD